MAIEACKDLLALENRYDPVELLECIQSKMAEVGQADSAQFLMTHRPEDAGGDHRWTFGAGTLYSYSMKKLWITTDKFTKLDESFYGTIVGECVSDVREIAKSYGLKIGRVRLLTLMPKTNLSLHKDQEPVRFHIPLVTTRAAFFISEDKVIRMPELGRLYVLRTDVEHTAVNAALTEKRVHLVFDTYE